ncbi:MAG TPA: carbon monoxide dehydrogenase subunit G [Hyphomicrobiaceae bacterium]|jgi:carbon monoxide dehydrogenase subunit G|nr:carbon monoxide dehydrogenase subunit G [Hyphomicrobiaceae bacterium]
MDMSGERRIAASRAAVWAALNDPEILRQCIPGCELLEMQSATEMTARVKLQIGPVRATFNGKIRLSDLDPPNSYRIAGEGSGGVAGYAKGGAKVMLSDEGGGTLMRYDVKADVGGKLAQLGGRLIDSTSKKLADEFFEKFSTLVGGPAPVAAAPVEVQAATATVSAEPGKKLSWFKRWFGRQKAREARP